MGYWNRARLARCRAALAALAVAGCLLPHRAAAQTTTLTLSGSTLTAATPAVADYTNGYVCLGTITATATTSGAAKAQRDTLFIRLTTALGFPASDGGTAKAASDFVWNTNAAGCAATSGWAAVPISTAVPARVIASTAQNGFTTIIYFRLALSWTLDRGGITYTLPGVKFYVNRSTTNPP